MRPIRLLAIAALLTLAGCAEVQRLAASAFEKPRLTFRSASLQALDLEGATVGFTFDLENPNDFGLSVARLGYGIEVDGTRVATGDLPGGLRIAAKGSSPVTFPVRVRFQDVPGIVSLFGRHDALPYRLTGTVGVQTPLGLLELPLSHSDTLALPRLPDFGIEGLSIRSVSFSEVGLEVRLRVRNPNAFPVPAGSLDYALSIAGSPVAHGEGRPLTVVPARGAAVVAIPVRVNLSQVGRVATELVRGAPVEVGLSGKAEVAGIPLPLTLGATVPAQH